MPGPYRAILYKEVYYMNTFTLKGTFLDTPAPDTLRIREGYLLCENGLCAGFSETAPAGVEVLDYTGKIITPGLVDLHLHAPQYSYCGTAMDLELLDWLQQYTYPEEAHYARLHLCDAAHRRNARTDAPAARRGAFRLCRQAGYGPQQP